MELTESIVKEYLDYNKETGIFVLKKKRSKNDSGVGKQFGYLDGRGYLHSSLLGRKYKLHRLAWMYVYGAMPIGQIDHINGNRTDNRICNLREVNQIQNSANIRKVRSLSGYKGVYPLRDKYGVIISWVAQHNKTHLGCFNTSEEAAKAYDEHLLKVHGDFAGTNKRIFNE